MKVDITNLRNIKSMTFEIPDGKVSLSSTKTAFKNDGDFTKRSMIGSARSALLNSPSQRIELIQNAGGKYLTWLIDGVSFFPMAR